MRRNRSPKWTLTILFLLSWLGASVTPVSAQKSFTVDQIWDQLQGRAYTAARNDGYITYLYYIVGALNKGRSDPNWFRTLDAGDSYFIVAVCDNDCADVDLALEDMNRVEIATDTAADDMPIIRFTPSTTTNYWVKVTMQDCRVEPCAYGIGIFVKYR